MKEYHSRLTKPSHAKVNKVNKSFVSSSERWLATGAEPMQCTGSDSSFIFHVTWIGSALVASHRSSFIFHMTSIGSALVASHRSSFIFHVTCIGSALVASHRSSFIFQRIISASLAEPMQVPMRGHEKMNKSFFERTRYSRVLVRIRSKWTNRSRTTHHYHSIQWRTAEKSRC